MRVFENANYAFIPNRRKAYLFSLLVTLLGLVSFATRGFEMGIDFTGGKEFVVSAPASMNVAQARAAISDAMGGSPEVKRYGNDLLVRVGPEAEGTATEVGAKVVAALGQGAEVRGYDEIAPRFASDLQRAAFWAVMASVFVIFLYVLARFEWTAGVGAIVSLIHDVVFTLSILSLIHI